MSNKKIPDIGMHHLALSSADYDASVKFYTEGLGFKEAVSWMDGETKCIILDVGNGSNFEIFSNGKGGEQQNARFVHFAFTPSDPDAAYNNAIAAGAVSHIPPKDVTIPSNPPMPVRIAFVKGPDGELLEVFKKY